MNEIIRIMQLTKSKFENVKTLCPVLKIDQQKCWYSVSEPFSSRTAEGFGLTEVYQRMPIFMNIAAIPTANPNP